jgi:hypothetical protein
MGVPVVHRVASLPSIALVAGEAPCDTEAEGTQFVRDSAVSVPPPLEEPLEEPLDELELLLLELLDELLVPPEPEL